MTTHLSTARRQPSGAALQRLLLAAGIALAVSACATPPPPTEQVAAASAAVTHAVDAGANEMAPMEIRGAREKLDRARIAVAAKDYDRALKLAEQSRADAQLAEALSASIKAGKAADGAQESNRVLREELSRKTN